MTQSEQQWLRSKHAAMGVTLDVLAPVVEDVCGPGGQFGQAKQIVAGHSSVVFDVPLVDRHVIVRAKVAHYPAYAAEQWARGNAWPQGYRPRKSWACATFLALTAPGFRSVWKKNASAYR